MEKSIHILVVDDNQENLKVVNNFLKEEGYKIALALEGKSALKVLDENKIDLILLDVMMPVMDGFEVCKKIKAIENLKDIPVIFLTAKAEIQDIVKGFQSGGVDYMTKPFNRDELLIRVKTHLDLSFTKEKLVETIKTRDKLYSIIVHDIRSPLSSIIMLINSIKDGLVDMNSEEFKEIINHLEKSANETNALLNNLLEWSKTQIGLITIKPELLFVFPMINDCIQLLSGNAKYKNISIETHIDNETVAFFDEITMHTVVRNIISNAIKFTPEYGKIMIETVKKENHTSIVVKDTGVGIPTDILQKILDKNEHYSSRGTKDEKGSGIGLKLVKDLVEQNKGTIEIESKEGEGTMFKVNLPCFE